VLLKALSIANEGHVRANRARIQKDAIIDVADISADDGGAVVARNQRCPAKVRRDIVILGKMVERSARQNRQLDVGVRDECCGGGDCAITAGHEDSLRSVIDCLLQSAFNLVRLDCVKVETRDCECLTRLFRISARRVEEGLGAGSGKREAGRGRRREEGSGRREAGGGRREAGRGKGEE